LRGLDCGPKVPHKRDFAYSFVAVRSRSQYSLKRLMERPLAMK
jgi:hypothetical protein